MMRYVLVFLAIVVQTSTSFKLRRSTSTLQSKVVSCPKDENEQVCGGAGECVKGVCFCEPGRTGYSCSLRVCPGNPTCAGNGVCFSGQCLCDDGFTGSSCVEAGKSSLNIKEDSASRVLVLERRKSDVQNDMKDVQKQIKIVLQSSKNGEEKAKSIQDLRKKASKLAKENEDIQTKLDALNSVGSESSDSEHEIAAETSGQNENLASQLAFELFCNDKRQEVALAMASNKTLTDEIADGAFSSAVDGELTKMWSKLPKAYREEYMAASKEALIVKDSTWAVAKKLYVDASGSDKAEEEWKALPPATKARFFMSAQSLVVGRHGPRELTNGAERPDVEKAVHSLQKSVHDLAFDLFSDEKFKWAESQVASRMGKSSHSSTSTSGSYPDIQHLLATTYRNISESSRQTYVRRAETLLSTSFFVSPQPEGSRNVDDALKASSTLSVPLHRTMITFTIQFLGLAESDADRKTRGIVDQAVDDMIRMHLRRQYRLVQQDDVSSVTTTPAFRRRYIMSLANGSAKLIRDAMQTVLAGVQQGDLAKRMREAGMFATPAFVLGAKPQVLTDMGSTQFECETEKDCNFKGTCEESQCRCRVEARNGTLFEFSGMDCSFGPSVVCPGDCSFRGVCGMDGTCDCQPGFGSSDCSVQTCPSDCSSHGVCMSTGTCACEPGYEGVDCATKAKARDCETGCSGHGQCDHSGKCACDSGFEGRLCADRSCDPTCEHGTCRNGTCVCDSSESATYKGKRCEIKTCYKNCHGHGTCENDGLPNAACHCDKGFSGISCSCPSQDGVECSGHGFCHESECYCHHLWGGEACDVPVCSPSPDCSGHGLCREGTCDCAAGWKGEDCGLKTPSKCVHGKVDGGLCRCDEGWLGDSCEAKAKMCGKSMCNHAKKQGTCIAVPGRAPLAVCACDEHFVGPECEFVSGTCKDGCSGHGVCRSESQDSRIGGECVCDENYYGSSCDVLGCDPKDEKACSGNGECTLSDSDAPYECKCSHGFVGRECEFEAGVEACALCCMGECLDMCQDQHGGDNAEVITCYPDCQSTCVSRCQKGEDEKCPSNRDRYAHLMAAITGEV